MAMRFTLHERRTGKVGGYSDDILADTVTIDGAILEAKKLAKRPDLGLGVVVVDHIPRQASRVRGHALAGVGFRWSKPCPGCSGTGKDPARPGYFYWRPDCTRCEGTGVVVDQAMAAA